MIRLKELKEKKYNPKYEELYKFIYSISINQIFDNSKYEPEPEGLDIRIRDDMKEEIRIQKVFKYFILTVDLVDNKKFEDCEYQKIEYYSFKNISNLVKKLKEILKERTNIITTEYENRPHKATYDLLTYVKMEVVADDSSWIEFNNNGLRITLTDDLINKLIFVEYTTYYFEPYIICYYDYELDDGEDSIKEHFKTEEEMLERLKELIKPCLKKKRLRDIGTRYISSRIAISRYGQTKKYKRKKQGEAVC